MFWVNFCGIEMFGCHLNQYLQSAGLSQSSCVKWNLILRRRTRLRKKPNNQCEYCLYLYDKSCRDNVIVDDFLCKYANRSTGQLFLQNDALDNCWDWELWQLVVLWVLADPFFAFIAIFGWGKFFGKFDKLWLRKICLQNLQTFAQATFFACCTVVWFRTFIFWNFCR